MTTKATPPFQANNAFFYYRNIDGAAEFYHTVLGANVVADYGFAKTLQLAHSSFLTLVDATKGMHTADEPKTVTLALVTEQVEDWYAYLTRQGVAFQQALQVQAGSPHDGFVALDSEGYFLEFERFNPHPENERLLPRLAALPPGPPAAGASQRPADLTIRATILWLYYQEPALIRRFYQSALGLEEVVEQGFAQIYATSPSGFLGPVLAGRGLHPYTEQKAVTISLLSDDLEAWFARLQQDGQFRLRTAEIVTRDRYRAFVGYDPEGYYMEFNTFLEHPDNQRLLQALNSQP
jgi:uncharacterized glyoxalase superfamily protein PhnB